MNQGHTTQSNGSGDSREAHRQRPPTGFARLNLNKRADSAPLLLPPGRTPAKRRSHAEHHHMRSHLEFAGHWTDRIADFLTAQFGTLWFLLLNAIVFVGWIEWNVGWFGFEPFDPYPFNLLTMFVSLEAIFLATIVLISQNRQGRVADTRQQVDMEIDVQAEAEIAKVLRMLDELHHHHGIAKKDHELEVMERNTNIAKIQREIERE